MNTSNLNEKINEILFGFSITGLVGYPICVFICWLIGALWAANTPPEVMPEIRVWVDIYPYICTLLFIPSTIHIFYFAKSMGFSISILVAIGYWIATFVATFSVTFLFADRGALYSTLTSCIWISYIPALIIGAIARAISKIINKNRQKY